MALAFLRQHQRWFHVLLGLVILGFIFFGPTTMFTDPTAAGSSGEEVGRVGDLPISAREYQRTYSRLKDQAQRMYSQSGELDPSILRMLGLDQRAFDQLVNERVIELEARRLGLSVSDREIAHMVSTLPIFLDKNGRFRGEAAVLEWVDAQRMTIEDFESLLRRDLLGKQLQAVVTDGLTVSPAEVEEHYRRTNENVKAEYVLVDNAAFRSQTSASDEETRAHFESNKETYRVPEKRVASYVHVDPMALRAQVTVTEADVTQSYEANKARHREEEEVCPRHVLIKVKDPASAEGRTDEQAKKLAEDVLAQLRAGADFAAVAKKTSEDEGSAAKGGDLGCFGRGRGTMPNEFENVAFNLKAGEFSEAPVKTTYGYHVIQVTRRRDEREKPLDEVKEQIKNELVTSRAQAEAERLKISLSAALSAGKKKLDEAAPAYGLKVATSEPMARGEQRPPFSEESVGRLFDMKPGETLPEPFSAGGGFLFISLAQAKPSYLPELAEVQARVQADVAEKKALEQARARALELKAKAGSGGLAKAASAMGLTRKETTNAVQRGSAIGDLPLGVALEEAAFSLPVGQLSDPIPVKNGYALIRVTERKAIDPADFEKQKATIAATLRATKRSQMFQAFMAQARQRIPIERRPEALSRLAG